MNNTEAIANLISRRHPEYQSKVAHWDFLISTYNGGREWFSDHIFRYFKEGDNEYNDRVNRAYRFNHSREIVDLINKYVFRGEINRSEEDVPQSVIRFWRHSTKRSADIGTYMRYLSKLSSIFGRIWVVVDSVNRGEGESIREADHRPYSYEVTPQNVLDMSFDEDGDLNWILIRETVRDDADPLTCTGKISERYRLWTRDGWMLFGQVGEKMKSGKKVPTFALTSEGKHDLGVVPVFPVDHMLSESLYTSPSLIDDIAYLDRAVANYLSNLDAIIQDQTFSQLALPAQGLLPGENEHTKVIEAGTKRIFTYDAEGGNAPFYLAPDPKQAELIITAIKQIINEIYHSVGVAGERTKQDNSMGIDNSSGVAKAYDFDRVNSLLVSKAAALQRAEMQLIDLVLRWSNDGDLESFGGWGGNKFVTYPSSFDSRGLYDELDISSRLELLTAPIELKRYQLKRLVSKLYPYMSETDKTKMEKAIEALDDSTDLLLSKLSGGLGSQDSQEGRDSENTGKDFDRETGQND